MRKLNLYVVILTTAYFILACNTPTSNSKKSEVSFDLSKETELIKNEVTKFSNDLKKGDSLYLYTDGYPDQFGGPYGKKFRYKQLEQLLAKNHELKV